MVNAPLNDSVEFCWPLRVYIEDTDAGGIVYYVNYLKYMERARTEYLRAYEFGKNAFSKDTLAKNSLGKDNFEENSVDKNSAGKVAANENYIFTDDLMFVVHAVAIEYHKPARLDDELFATARILASGAAQIRFQQRILRGSEALSSEILCSGEVKVVCVDRHTFKPRRIPKLLLETLLTA